MRERDKSFGEPRVRFERLLVAIAIIKSQLFTDVYVPRRDEYEMRLSVHFKGLRMTIAARLRVVKEATEARRLGRGVHTIPLAFVLEEVHVAADGFIARVLGLASFGLRMAYSFARVLAHELTAQKWFRGEHAAALALHASHRQAVLLHETNCRLDLGTFLLVQVGPTFASAFADQSGSGDEALFGAKVVGDFSIATAAPTTTNATIGCLFWLWSTAFKRKVIFFSFFCVVAVGVLFVFFFIGAHAGPVQRLLVLVRLYDGLDVLIDFFGFGVSATTVWSRRRRMMHEMVARVLT